ncbi:DUF2341 domain-containing protein [Candidatus Woesebacteria bacterium]|nr:DUF2341 domain-containing protein [Candidatus Woesebacteria bacterium]
MKKLVSIFLSLGLLLIVPASAQAGFSVDTDGTLQVGLVSFWKMDVSSAGSAHVNRVDSYRDNNLRDPNTVASGVGIKSNGVDFEATNEEYLEIEDNADLSTGDIDFTISAWVKLETKTAHGSIVSKRDAAWTGEYELLFNVNQDRFQFVLIDDTQTVCNALANNLGSPSTGTWYHIVAWHDASANNCGIKVNNGTTDTASETGIAANTAANFRIGARYTAETLFFDGIIDEVGFWKKVLSTQEITDLYNSGAANSFGACAPNPSGDLTVSTSCSFPSFTDGANSARKVHGVDTGTLTTNSAKLTSSGGILTINADETVAVGSLELTGGSIAIAEGGEIKIGMPLWVIDADADGFAASRKLYAQTTAPTNGKRRNTLTAFSPLDCDDAVAQVAGCFRRPIVLTNASGQDLTNEQVLISVDTATPIAAGKMTSDCGDIRMKDSDNSTALTYWIEGRCNTTATQIWVTVPSIPTVGKVIYMNYEGTTATNGFSSWAGKFTLLNDASCPSGWTANADFLNKFPRGATTYGGTGGASSHSHAQESCTTGNSVGYFTRSGTTNSVTTTSHTHTGAKVDVDTASNVYPPYTKMVTCESANLDIDAGLIALFDAAVGTGWTRFTAMDGKFLMGHNTTYGGTGGATTHSHSTSGGYATGNPGTDLGVSTLTNNNSIGGHTHLSSDGTTGTANHLPPYLDMIFGSKNADGAAKAGIITIVDVLPPLGWTRFSALDSNFVRGASSYGGTGGTTTHVHTNTINVAASTAAIVLTDDRVTSVTAASNSHTHSCSSGNTDSVSNLPPYTNAIFAQRNTPTATVAVGSEEYQY